MYGNPTYFSINHLGYINTYFYNKILLFYGSFSCISSINTIWDEGSRGIRSAYYWFLSRGIAPIRLFWCAVGQEIDDIISKALGNIVSYKEYDETSEGEWKMQIDK